jgi:hypothetical protein
MKATFAVAFFSSFMAFAVELGRAVASAMNRGARTLYIDE